jgi:hypothetical protein
MIAEASSRDAMLAAVPKLRAFAISLCRNGDHAETSPWRRRRDRRHELSNVR